jgi:hypothetical protein
MNVRTSRSLQQSFVLWSLLTSLASQAQTLNCVPPGAPPPQPGSGIRPCPPPGSDPSNPMNGLNPHGPASVVQRQLQQMIGGPGGPGGMNRGGNNNGIAGAGGAPGMAGAGGSSVRGASGGVGSVGGPGGMDSMRGVRGPDGVGGVGGPGGMDSMRGMRGMRGPDGMGGVGGAGGMGGPTPGGFSGPMAFSSRGISVFAQGGNTRNQVGPLNPMGGGSFAGTPGAQSNGRNAAMPFIRPSAIPTK